eukprot:4050866-Pleurochrysis_carterae.AAC.1
MGIMQNTRKAAARTIPNWHTRLTSSLPFISRPLPLRATMMPFLTVRLEQQVGMSAEPPIEDLVSCELLSGTMRVSEPDTSTYAHICTDFFILETRVEWNASFCVGFVILPIVGNAAEHSTAIVMAYKNKMDL